MSDLMTAYLDQLTRELSFDPSLARRMRAEAEDHLQEAVASDPMGGRPRRSGGLSPALAQQGTSPRNAPFPRS
jgi:hypothetical protein